MLYSLDRFEDDLAVLVGENGAAVTVPCTALPTDAAEGDMFRDTAEGFVPDERAAAQRRSFIRALLKRLHSRS